MHPQAYVLGSNIAVEEMLYDEQDLINTMDKIEPINYHQQIEVNGIKFWCYNAGTRPFECLRCSSAMDN